MPKTVEQITQDVFRIKGSAIFKDVNHDLGEYCLPVEPLSESKTIHEFMKEGGAGFNSLKNGTLGSNIYKVSSTLNNRQFSYGNEYMSLYNAGYPLHRILEGPSFLNNSGRIMGPVAEIIIRARKKNTPRVFYMEGSFTNVTIPDNAENAVYLNEYAAKAMGLAGKGIIFTGSDHIQYGDEMPHEIWDKRFLEDSFPHDHITMKFFTMKSRLQDIEKIIDNTCNGLFSALAIHKGMLLIISGTEEKLSGIIDNILSMSLTFRVG